VCCRLFSEQFTAENASIYSNRKVYRIVGVHFQHFPSCRRGFPALVYISGAEYMAALWRLHGSVLPTIFLAVAGSALMHRCISNDRQHPGFSPLGVERR
jgi:hypothetical protein